MKSSPPPTVFFNASVIIAGLHSPQGDSGLLLNWVKTGKIQGLISQIVADEVIRHSPKINLPSPKTLSILHQTFATILPPPAPTLVRQQMPQVTDPGDAHLFASCLESSIDYLTSLDKKHVLSLKSNFHQFQILSPAQLIQKLRQPANQ